LSFIHFFSFLGKQEHGPQILGPSQVNRTLLAEVDASVQFSCEVVSLGPTQVQWLKQLHDNQAPSDRNKTIVVFDYIFEVRLPLLHQQISMKRSEFLT
jgi:hypothetical protein